MNNAFSTKKVLLSLLSLIIIIISQILADISGIIAYATAIPDWIGNIIISITYVVLVYFMSKYFCKNILKISLSDCRIGKLKIKLIWLISAFLLPGAVSAVLLSFPGELIKNPFNTAQLLNTITMALFYLGMAVGIAEELIFRGIIMYALERRWNEKIAIIIPSMVFGLLHIESGMNFISTLLLFIAGTGVGIMFSLITYESGSVWNSAVVHGIWNCIIIGNILNIGEFHNNSTIFSYVLESKSVILTGGEFGIEASIIAVIGYILLALLAFYLWKNPKHSTLLNEKNTSISE